MQRSAVAFPLGIALQYPSHPFGNDALRVAAVTATAVIDRLRKPTIAPVQIEQTSTGVIVAPVRGRMPTDNAGKSTHPTSRR